MKYLLLFAVLYVLWRVWKKRQSVSVKPPSERRPLEERMVLCAHCGVHLPESEALQEHGLSFCCEAHRAAAATSEK